MIRHVRLFHKYRQTQEALSTIHAATVDYNRYTPERPINSNMALASIPTRATRHFADPDGAKARSAMPICTKLRKGYSGVRRGGGGFVIHAVLHDFTAVSRRGAQSLTINNTFYQDRVILEMRVYRQTLPDTFRFTWTADRSFAAG